MENEIVGQIEAYVRGLVFTEGGHDFGHFNRVRNWAKKIAKDEGYENLAMVEVTALMHDIGLAQAEPRYLHGKIGGELTLKYLTEQNFFNEEQRQQIAEAISLHNTIEKNPNNDLVAILRDADILDLLGAAGIMRTFIAKHEMPAYVENDIKGLGWQKGNDYFTQLIKAQKPICNNIIDQLNFNLSCVENMQTSVGKNFANDKVDYLKKFIEQLEREIIDK
jgi:HD superfamily phosphodiesterase